MSRGVRTLVGVLVVGAGLSPVVVSGGSPAGAVPPRSCVEDIAGPSGVISPAPAAAGELTTTTVELRAPRRASQVEDVDVTFAIAHDNAAKLRVRLAHADATTIVQRRFMDSGPQVRPLGWDDEAGTAYAPGSSAGTYLPDEALSAHDGSAAGGTWSLLVDNWASFEGRLVSWSIRISYATCDADGDGVEDHSDNCTPAANPDQADTDRDGIGDACDGDLDGDGAVGVSDNCPLMSNASQADTDADSLGDACDADDDDDGRGDASDGCALVSATTATGCPVVATEMRLRKKKGRLLGRVASDRRECVTGSEVTLKRARPGRDQKLVVLSTRSQGRFRTKVPRLTGRYYVLVRSRYVAGVAECRGSRSRAIRIRRGSAKSFAKGAGAT